MSEILGREVNKKEYDAMVENGEVLADKLPSYMVRTDGVGFIPLFVVPVVATVGTDAAIGGVAVVAVVFKP